MSNSAITENGAAARERKLTFRGGGFVIEQRTWISVLAFVALIGLWQLVGLDAIGHAQHARREEGLGVDAPPEPPRRHDPFPFHQDAGHLDRAQPLERGDDALGEVVMAWPRIGEEDHFERRHWVVRTSAP